jgi:hypothetical protein
MGQREINISEMVGAYPVCEACGSTKVIRNAGAAWAMEAREWELVSVYDDFHCGNCGLSGAPEWKLDKAFRRKCIRRLNDTLRNGAITENATIVVTQGVQANGHDFLVEASRAIAAFDEFDGDNDPHHEHDFGAVEVAGQKLFWKVDYFDLRLKFHSPDAANPALTHRVLTIMLASEY